MASLIRQDDKNVPIIFLTAYDSDENMFEAIELGGFGVLKKPFEKRELVVMMSFATNKFKSDFASVDLKNGFSFNVFSRELFKDGVSIALTKKEQNLLHLLLKNNGKTVSFEMIESCVWQEESCTPDTIRSFVYKL
ncbi:response regulator transcription factor [Campylobacter curvus]|uniref:response regulator transcription factor n=1 Tax=Campylobacter curvus TaxID=200 RepID=UPI0024B58021|nr:response regulator [Campylobacter curvus]